MTAKKWFHGSYVQTWLCVYFYMFVFVHALIYLLMTFSHMYAVLASLISLYFSDRYLNFCIRYHLEWEESKVHHVLCFPATLLLGIVGILLWRGKTCIALILYIVYFAGEIVMFPGEILIHSHFFLEGHCELEMFFIEKLMSPHQPYPNLLNPNQYICTCVYH